LVTIYLFIVYLRESGEAGNAYKPYSDNLKGTDHLEDLGANERIILKRILKKWRMEMWTGLI
jgi:hypothetical protein